MLVHAWLSPAAALENEVMVRKRVDVVPVGVSEADAPRVGVPRVVRGAAVAAPRERNSVMGNVVATLAFVEIANAKDRRASKLRLRMGDYLPNEGGPRF